MGCCSKGIKQAAKGIYIAKLLFCGVSLYVQGTKSANSMLQARQHCAESKKVNIPT